MAVLFLSIRAVKTSFKFFTNFLKQATNLQENQNTNEQEQANDQSASEVNETSETVLPPTAATPVAENTETISQPETQNSKPETETMEVQKHPHHVMHKKKWNEYLLEFFMLFLAVFLGFVAENIRERLVEHEREEQYASQMFEDLKSDSAFFAHHVLTVQKMLKKHQEFYNMMTGNAPLTDKEVLNGCLPLLYTFDILATTATYSQMKASGGLRYVKNKDLINAMQKYYEVLLPRTQKAYDIQNRYYENVINPYQLRHFRAQDCDYIADSVKTNKPVILNRSPETDQELINILNEYKFQHEIFLNRIAIPTKKQIDKLMAKLREEYHLG